MAEKIPQSIGRNSREVISYLRVVNYVYLSLRDEMTKQDSTQV